MREIKFRAWSKLRNEMDTNPVWPWIEDTEINWGFAHSSDYVYMQFTGLHDKDGKEIYEGDICSSKFIVTKHFVVEYHADNEYVGFVPHEIGAKDISVFTPWSALTVIGNTWENPELLK
jgi:uncharacterized phage protein (TIGR01671 family)